MRVIPKDNDEGWGEAAMVLASKYDLQREVGSEIKRLMDKGMDEKTAAHTALDEWNIPEIETDS